MPTATSFCRFCHAFCGIEVEIEDGRAVRVRGDTANPMSEGFTCIKGRALPEQHAHPDRLLQHQRRRGDGRFEPVSLADACDDIAARLGRIIDEHGPRAVALYGGTAAYQNATGLSVGRAWITALGSPSFYTSLSIDQPNKLIAPQLHGGFMAGGQSFASSDVWMVFGCNSLVSMYGGTSGFPSFNPTKRLREAKRRGLDLIVVDPRRSELAKQADLHLQVKPGEDAALLAGMLRVILDEELQDADFVTTWTNGIDELAKQVAGFTPELVERRTGVAWDDVVQAARRFAARGRRGLASSGTGPSMAPRPNLTEYLILCLNTLCGRYNRAGDVVANPGTLMPKRSFFEGALPPMPGYRMGPQSRIRGLAQIGGELPTAALSDEILTEGEGRVRALVVLGGNPMMAWPDQLKTRAALEALDLLVVVDPLLGATAGLADYVIAPTLSLERPDATSLMDTWYPEAYAMYTPAVVEPASPDVTPEWALFWELASRMGTQVTLAGGPLPLDVRPDTDAVLDLVLANARVPLDEVRRHPHGALFPTEEPVVVKANQGEPKPALGLATPEMMESLGEVLHEAVAELSGDARPDAFAYRLISRRLREVCNSVGRELASLRAKRPYNPAFMHPDDLEKLGVRDGAMVEIESARARVRAIVEASPDIRPGVISMAHAWGSLPGDDDEVEGVGTSTARLIDNASGYDPISGIPVQSAIPVNVRPL